LRWHLERFVEPGPDSLVFVGPKGGRLRRSNFRNIWINARNEAGLPGLHLHDLRHTGNTMAAATGASLRELMERMGHSSTRAALIYQHATRERDEAIAAGMGQVFASARRKGAANRRSHATGTKEGHGFLMAGWAPGGTGLDLGFLVGAGEGNRTLMTSLEGWGSAIELRPRSSHAGRMDDVATPVAYRLEAPDRAWQGQGTVLVGLLGAGPTAWPGTDLRQEKAPRGR
jgi:Phage integrase family